MANLRELATLPRILGLVVVPAASLVVDHEFGTTVLTALLLTVYVALLFAFLIDHNKLPGAYLKTRKLHAVARARAEGHPILMRRYEDGISETEHLLQDIVDEQFEYSVTEVPEMSIFAMDIVNGRCLLTFPLEESENLLVPRTGSAGRYYAGMLAASRRIKANGRRGVVRVFIIARQDDIGPSLLEFMQANAADGIHVRVLFEDHLPPAPDGVEFRDFGCYETSDGKKWIMALRKSSFDSNSLRYVVNTNESVYGKYRSYGDDIVRLSTTLEEFEELLLDPMNGRLWPLYFAERKYIMNPPHGLSEEDAEFIVDTALHKIQDASHGTVLVLGFTPKLIRRLIDRKVGGIISVDQCRTKPSFDIIYETENWLKLKNSYDADAIVFDESINNLSRLQLGLFFANMAKALKPGGVMVGRVMGRFEAEKAAIYASMSQGRALELLRKTQPKTHDDVAPLVICLLHGEAMSFNRGLSTADCEAWNTSLLGMRNQRLISQDEYSKWHLPFSFKLLSPDQAILMKEAGNVGLLLAEVHHVQGEYIERWPDIEHFYRILSFENLI